MSGYGWNYYIWSRFNGKEKVWRDNYEVRPGILVKLILEQAYLTEHGKPLVFTGDGTVEGWVRDDVAKAIERDYYEKAQHRGLQIIRNLWAQLKNAATPVREKQEPPPPDAAH